VTLLQIKKKAFQTLLKIQMYLRMLVWSDFSRTFTTKRFTERITCCPSSRSSIRESSIKVMRPCIKSFSTPVEASRARLSIWNSYAVLTVLARLKLNIQNIYCMYFFETGSCYIAHVGLEFIILLPQPPMLRLQAYATMPGKNVLYF
jgi:hypothetical protein